MSQNEVMSSVFAQVNGKPVVVSLDIHDRSTYMFVVDVRSGEVLVEKRVEGHFKNVVRHLKRLGRRDEVVVLFESGPLGNAPYRLFTKRGFYTRQIATVSIPKRNKMNKSDRNDARENLQYFLSGKLTFVTVPSEEQEDARECLRYRYHIVCDITSEKQRIHSQVKRLGLWYDLTVSYWTKAHYRWLKTVPIPPCSRVVLDARLRNLQRLEDNLKETDAALDAHVAAIGHLQRICDYYQLLPGFGRVNALVMTLEGGDLNRFRHCKPLMNYVGLVPGRWQSGEKDPVLRITKAGNKYLRTALVGAAKSYRDYRSLISARRLKALPAPLAEFIDRCQHRLSMRYRHLVAHKKHSNKARVAIARELCGFVWEFYTRVMPELENTYLSKAA